MGQQFSKTNNFRQLLRKSLDAHVSLATIRVGKDQPIYVSGDSADMVYFIESGQIKLLMVSQGGKECLLAIHTGGDIFGELCLDVTISRQEAAIVMEDTVLKVIPCRIFFFFLSSHSLLDGFVPHPAPLLRHQDRTI